MFGPNRSIKSKNNTGIIFSGDGNDVSVSYGAIDKPVPLQIPFKPNSVRDTVDSLLIWESRLTDLIGREEEKEELKTWLNNKQQRVSIRTIYGQGGVGKTRLAFEFAEEVRNEGWEAGQLPLSKNGLQYRFGEKGTLLIIDYPEQQTRQLQLLLKAIKKAEEPPEEKLLRILLLSRNEGFIDDLTDEVRHLFDKPLPLSAIDSKEYSWQLFQQAYLKIHKVKDMPEPPLPIDENVFKQWQEKDQLHRTPLFILAYTLNLVEDPEKTDLTGGEVIKGLVAREKKRLKLEATDHNLDGKSLIVLKALAGISGDLNKSQIKALAEITKLDGLAPDNIDQLSVWQASFTDETGEQQPGCFPRMQPDLLAAALLAETLATQDQSGLLQYAALEVAKDMAIATSQLGRLMHDAIQVIGIPWSDKALIKYVVSDVEKCKALEACLNRSYLEKVLISLSLAILKILIEEELDPVEKARDLNHLSVRLAENGKWEEGLVTIQRAVEIREKLAEENFDTHASDLAKSLSNMSVCLAENKKRKAGLIAIQRAVDICEKLAGENFASYGSDLAACLNNLSVDIAKIGNREESLAATQRAVGIYDKLAEKNTAYRSDLAMSLYNLSDRMTESREREAGLAAIQRAVEIYEELVEENYAANGPDLAMSLYNLSNRLAKIGERELGKQNLLRAIEIITPFAIEGTLYKDRLHILQQTLKSFD